MQTVAKIKCSCGQKVSNKYNFTKHCERFHNNEKQQFKEIMESNIPRPGIAIVSIAKNVRVRFGYSSFCLRSVQYLTNAIYIFVSSFAELAFY